MQRSLPTSPIQSGGWLDMLLYINASVHVSRDVFQGISPTSYLLFRDLTAGCTQVRHLSFYNQSALNVVVAETTSCVNQML